MTDFSGTRWSVEDCLDAGNHVTNARLSCSPNVGIGGCRRCRCGRHSAHVSGCAKTANIETEKVRCRG